MKVLILNGPNLNLLGTREPGIYGQENLKQIISAAGACGRKRGVKVDAFQSNDEGALISKIQEAAGRYAGLIFNPAGYTHTSVALRDALLAVDLPCVEVHLSNIHAREDFRRRTLTTGACIGVISGFGGKGYLLALDALVDYLERKQHEQKVKKTGKQRKH